ncbi:MAG: DUF1622 domain-containing protein [Sedimentisphaerales bacterium]|jgi:uncharacterized membrane protein
MEDVINFINDLVVIVCQILAMIVILMGISKALIIYVKDIMVATKSYEALQESRLEIGHAFSLGLAFLIGASILKTIIAPTWDDIGKLAAIIAIRTALNFFLLRDVQDIFSKKNSEPTKEAGT